MRHRTSRLLAAIGATSLLAACGGATDGVGTGVGLGSGSYALQSAYVARKTAGESTAFTVSGSCAGVATVVAAPATAGTFQGVSAQVVVNSEAFTFTNCAPASTTTSNVDFFNAAFALIGRTNPDSTQVAVLIPPAATLPSSVQVGSSGSLGAVALFADNTSTTLVGQVSRSFVVEADAVSGSTAVIVNFIDRQSDANAALQKTTQTRYRLDSSGVLTKIGIDIQNSGGSATHLILTHT